MRKVSILILITVYSATICSYPVKNDKSTIAYLTRFGYVENENTDKNSLVVENINLRTEGDESSIKEKIRRGLEKFQNFAGLPKTGQLDEVTIKTMNLPRCGNSERKNFKNGRSRRFVIDSKWEKTFLTYKILNYPRFGIDKKTVEFQIQKAFDLWANETNLVIKKVKNDKEVHDMEISFVTGKHNDGVEFDEVSGVGLVIAHAWKPFNANPLRGDLHFNDGVRWTTGGVGDGYDFFRTAVHEAGHALGLEHSPHTDAVMYFAINGHNPKLTLSRDDKAGIRELYGAKRDVNGGGSATGKNSPKLGGFNKALPNSVRPIVVPSGTPGENQPWECYRLQEQEPQNTEAIKLCYQQFYKDYYLSLYQG